MKKSQAIEILNNYNDETLYIIADNILNDSWDPEIDINKPELYSSEVYYHSDQKAHQCVITSVINAMRRYCIINNTKWSNITITKALKQGARQGAYKCSFNNINFRVRYKLWPKSERNVNGLRLMLEKHPEGVCIFGAKTSLAKKKSGTAHGILITEYNELENRFYGVNSSHNSKRYGYKKSNGKGIEPFDNMKMSTDLSRYSRISYLDIE